MTAWWEERRPQLILGSTLVVLAIVSLFGSWKTGHDQAEVSRKLTDYVQCQQRWTTFLYASLTSGRQVNSEAQAALDELVDAVTQARSSEETRQALERYKLAREKQKVTATENPLPPPPGEVCELQ